MENHDEEISLDDGDDNGDDSNGVATGAGISQSAALQRSIPSWDEAIGFIVDTNMQSRSQRRPPSRSGGGSRDNGSRGGRGRGRARANARDAPLFDFECRFARQLRWCVCNFVVHHARIVGLHVVPFFGRDSWRNCMSTNDLRLAWCGPATAVVNRQLETLCCRDWKCNR